MKNYFLFIIIFCFLPTAGITQIDTTSEWTWIKGDSTTNVAGVYGVKGTADPANKPGARESGVSWTDVSGNLWLFGGGLSNLDLYNDLWKYDPLSNQWTWVNGDNYVNATSVYGTKGIADDANKPGARWRSVSWIDNLGNLWLFGGRTYDQASIFYEHLLNDLWKYDPVTNQWTWMNGDSTGDVLSVYGTQGLPSVSNTPGSREWSVGGKDDAGNFWLFGGQGYAPPNSTGYALNDLWKYDLATNEWTWMKGDSTLNSHGVYGIKGSPGIANKPGGRFTGVSWTDLTGNLWLMGGVGFASSGGSTELNDLWKYDRLSNQWTWVKGDNTGESRSIYGIKGIPSINNQPGGRQVGTSWKDSFGSFWLFGGAGPASSTTGETGGVLNDLWKYDVSTNEWTWINGDTLIRIPGIYGMKGIAGLNNKPGSRISSIPWADPSGNLWIFAGSGYAANNSPGYLNDFWKLSNLSVVPLTLLNISATLKQKNVEVSWQTTQQINSDYFIVERGTDGRNFIPIGTQAAGGNSVSIKNYSFMDLQAQQGINYYRVKMIDKDGSFKYSAVVKITFEFSKNKVTIYPNPVINVATINITTITNAKLKLSLYNSEGKLISIRQTSVVTGNNSFTIDMRKLAKGVYTASIVWKGERENVTIVKD